VQRNENEFRKNPCQYAKKKLLPAEDSVEPSFNVSSTVDHFIQTYSNDNANYHSLPSWIIDSLPKCTTSVFDKAPIRGRSRVFGKGG